MAAEFVTTDDGFDIAIHDLGGVGPQLLAVHAASLCAAVFAPLAHELVREFSLVAPDLRGHGRSRGAGSHHITWSRLADDIAQVLDCLDGPVFGFGHSLGATSLLLAAARRPHKLRAIVAYEPVLLLGDAAAGFAEAQASRSERRYDRFASIHSARSRLVDRAPLDRLEPAALEGYLQEGFIEDNNGEVALVLEPASEASLYRAGVGLMMDTELSRVRCPVSIITGEQSGSAGELGADHLLSLLPGASASELRGRGHFGPLEDSKSTADLIRHAFATPAA